MKFILFYWILTPSNGVTEHVDPRDFVTELQCHQAIATMNHTYEDMKLVGYGLNVNPVMTPKKIALTWTCEVAYAQPTIS